MGTCYIFGDCRLDTHIYELHRGGQQVPLTPKVFDLLVYLIEHRDRVVGAEELLAAIWQGELRSNTTLSTCLGEARRAVGDSGETQGVIKTVPRRGWRFVAPIEERPTADTPPPTPLQGSLDLRIWEPGNADRCGVVLEARGALPLGPGDAIRLEVTLTRLAYLYLVWIDPQGQSIPLFPWRPGDWGALPGPAQPRMQVWLPEVAEEAWPLEGRSSGTETVLLLARETPLPAEVDLGALLAALPGCEGRQLYKPLWYENWVPKLGGEARRALNVGRTVRIAEADGVEARHQVLQSTLAAHFAYSLSVSFPSQGSDTPANTRA